MRPSPSTSNRPPTPRLRSTEERRRGRGAQSNASGPLRAAGARRLRRRLAELRRVAAVQDHGDDRCHAARSSPATIRRTSRSIARSIPIAAASTAASTASRGRPTPISASRPASISRSKLFAKPDAPKLLERELSAPGYVPRTIAIGTNTDPYQPIERQYQIMRAHSRSAGALRPSGRHRDQVGAGAARPRHSRAHGEAQSGQGRAVGDDARSRSSRA